MKDLNDINISKSVINEEDAMLSKKHLGPQACASCDKNLINISGMPVDYHVWKKLPFRDMNDRIARYGPGFSKLLSSMRNIDDFNINQTPNGLP
jgi:hypothetical protein